MKVVESKKQKADEGIDALVDFLRDSEESFTFSGGFPRAEDNADAVINKGYKKIHTPLLRRLAKSIGITTMGKTGHEVLKDIASAL